METYKLKERKISSLDKSKPIQSWCSVVTYEKKKVLCAVSCGSFPLEGHRHHCSELFV